MRGTKSLTWLGVTPLLLLLMGCATVDTQVAVGVEESDPAPEAEASAQEETQPSAEQPPEPAESTSSEDEPAPDTSQTTRWPENWQDMPVVPEVSDTAREIYRSGLEMGNDPHRFSVVGDCQNVSVYFLGAFDDPAQYSLGEYTGLQDTVDHFAGSFSAERVAADGGFSVATVLSPLWADPERCQSGESPLECEFRLNNPSIVFISMETWWYDRPADTYAGYMRQIVDYSIAEGVLPILATKADNLEGDHAINQAIVSVAQEYDVPLWNFWAAVQPLPGHGLTEDAFHLTYARPLFDDEEVMQNAWPVRNLTALQSLDAVWQAVSEDAEVASN